VVQVDQQTQHKVVRVLVQQRLQVQLLLFLILAHLLQLQQLDMQQVKVLLVFQLAVVLVIQRQQAHKVLLVVVAVLYVAVVVQ
jgi:hypothetical protein